MITSTAENGPTSASMSLRADVIVGADGVNSGRAQHGWLHEPGVIGEQLCTHDCEGSGQPVVRGVLDPTGILRPGTAGWRPGLLLGCSPRGRRRLRRCLAATLGLPPGVATGTSRRSGPVGAGVVFRRPAGQYRPPASTVGAGSPAAWSCSATRPMPWPPNLGAGSEQRSGRRRGPSRGTRQGTIGDGCPGRVRQAPAPTSPGACRRRPRCCNACVASSKSRLLRVRDALLAGLARFPRLSERGHPSGPGRRRPSYQIGIPTRQLPLSRSSRESHSDRRQSPPTADLENPGPQPR